MIVKELREILKEHNDNDIVWICRRKTTKDDYDVSSYQPVGAVAKINGKYKKAKKNITRKEATELAWKNKQITDIVFYSSEYINNKEDNYYINKTEMKRLKKLREGRHNV